MKSQTFYAVCNAKTGEIFESPDGHLAVFATIERAERYAARRKRFLCGLGDGIVRVVRIENAAN